MKLEIEYQEKINCTLHINDTFVLESLDSKIHLFVVNSSSCNIKVYLQPFKIKPLVRIDGILVNYGLAKITPWDHMLEFDYKSDFFHDYMNNIIDNKMKHFGITSRNCDRYIASIGIGSDCHEIVQEIYDILNLKE